MKKLWLIRKDEEAVSPVIATILMVAITVVLAAVLYVMVSGLLSGPGTVAKTIGINKTTAGGNHSLLVSSTPSGLTLDSVKLTIKDNNGVVKAPMSAVAFSSLTSANWGTYKVLYQKVATGDTELTIGASLLVYISTYPAGYRYEIADATSILASGTF